MLTKLTNKKGVIEEEVIQTKWTDWIDYWAVDFNYNDREELILSYDGDDLNKLQLADLFLIMNGKITKQKSKMNFY